MRPGSTEPADPLEALLAQLQLCMDPSDGRLPFPPFDGDHVCFGFVFKGATISVVQREVPHPRPSRRPETLRQNRRP